MSKAFTKEDEAPEPLPFRSRFQPLPAGFRNLVTAAGAAALRAELIRLQGDAPADASHLSPDDQKKLLRLQIDDLARRLETHEIVEPPAAPVERVAFGSTVLVRDEDGNERTYVLVGLDETTPETGRISWTSPLARALLNQRLGSVVRVNNPKGDTDLEILAVR